MEGRGGALAAAPALGRDWATQLHRRAMTPEQLNDTLDAMAAAAGDDPNLLPGLITVETDHWVHVLSAVRAKCTALHDGLRHRNIVIHVGSQQKTKVLTRAEAGERGAPYRDLVSLS